MGQQFTSNDFLQFYHSNNINLYHSHPYWPQANGAVERQNKTIQIGKVDQGGPRSTVRRTVLWSSVKKEFSKSDLVLRKHDIKTNKLSPTHYHIPYKVVEKSGNVMTVESQDSSCFKYFIPAKKMAVSETELPTGHEMDSVLPEQTTPKHQIEDFSTPRKISEKRIVNGKPTGKNEYPWMVHLSNGCGGSIITEYHVLTAAHCTDGTLPEFILVFLGKYYKKVWRGKRIQSRKVVEIAQHEGYSSRGYDFDLSILLLEYKINFNHYVGPVCMPHARFDLQGKFIKITGDNQAEFRRGESTLNQIPKQMLEKLWKVAEDEPALIVDFKAAYDSECRNCLWKIKIELAVIRW
ncbi:unnamed protein product [Nezara viridula]|uniref:Peptidase S1 domain-containing protein n=1 Tax=Nezara viridula TaxID=85310 RepID=A0A9P0HUI5_NEZVI|nr:unnamed protein product [Nezara viridula]